MTKEMNDLLQAVAAEWGQGSQEHNIARDVCKLANKEIEALTAEIEGLRKALEEAPIIGLREGLVAFRFRQDEWLKTKYREALEKQP
jgi:hypothetical protein